VTTEFRDDQSGGVPHGAMARHQAQANRIDFVRLFLRYASLGSTVRRALKVAAVVTPILTLLNHSAELLSLQLDRRFWLQVILTFFVPYSVSTYSSAMGAMQEHRRMEEARAPGRG
jgi:hypothetical protein